jgi:hypothetical protein
MWYKKRILYVEIYFSDYIPVGFLNHFDWQQHVKFYADQSRNTVQCTYAVDVVRPIAMEL